MKSFIEECDEIGLDEESARKRLEELSLRGKELIASSKNCQAKIKELNDKGIIKWTHEDLDNFQKYMSIHDCDKALRRFNIQEYGKLFVYIQRNFRKDDENNE